MTVADINTEEACQIAVSQAMKHMRPDAESEILNAEDTFPEAAARSDAPHPAIVSAVASRVEAGVGRIFETVSEEGVKRRSGGLKTTISNPEAIERDKLNYLQTYRQDAENQHIPGLCPCEDCVNQQQALMDWALQAAHQQHSAAVAEAYAAAEAAQRSGEGPKPMMVTPYKHNWVISGSHPEHESGHGEDETYASTCMSLLFFSADSSILKELLKTYGDYGRAGRPQVKFVALCQRTHSDVSTSPNQPRPNSDYIILESIFESLLR